MKIFKIPRRDEGKDSDKNAQSPCYFGVRKSARMFAPI